MGVAAMAIRHNPYVLPVPVPVAYVVSKRRLSARPAPGGRVCWATERASRGSGLQPRATRLGTNRTELVVKVARFTSAARHQTSGRCIARFREGPSVAREHPAELASNGASPASRKRLTGPRARNQVTDRPLSRKQALCERQKCSETASTLLLYTWQDNTPTSLLGH